MEIYEPLINPLQRELMRWMRERKPDIADEACENFSKALATFLVLGAEYGAGDALAGYLLLRFANKEFVEKLMEGLKRLGLEVEGIIKARGGHGAFVTASQLMDWDWGDEKINSMLRDLRRMAASGGAYPIKWREK